MTAGPGAADVLRHERAHALPQRAPHAAQAARLADRPGHQRERHDHHGRDLLRRQRLPRRAGGGAASAPSCSCCSPTPPGVFTADPRMDPAAKLVDEVTDFEALARARRSAHATSPLGSGGMRSKVVAAEMATAAGIATVIGSGLEPGVLAPRAGAGEPAGTRCPPGRAASRASSCGSSTPSRPTGTLRVDAGAARALREGGTSLLPVGHRRRRGPFDAGDAVEVVANGAPRSARASATTPRRAAPRHGPEVRPGARGAAARDRGGRPPGLLRAGLDWPCHGHRVPLRHRPLPAPPRPPRARSRSSSSAPRTRRCCAIADALEERAPEILEANARDLEAGRESGLSDALMDRLALDAGADRRRSPPASARSPRCPTRSAR